MCKNSWALMVQSGVVTKMSWSIKNNPSSLKKPVTAPTPHWQRYLYRLATMNTLAQRIVLCWADRTAVVLQSVAYRRTVGLCRVCVSNERGGVSGAWASLLQSNDKQPSFLWERYKAFFPTAEAKLRTMKPEEFAQIQQAVITQMLQAPQTLGEEASKLSKDFDRGNMRFDSRDKIVAQIKTADAAKKLLISSIRRWSSRKVWLFCRRFPAARMGKPNMCILKAGKCGRTSARCSKQCPDE